MHAARLKPHWPEAATALALAAVIGLAVGAASGVELRYKIAGVLALMGFTGLVVLPERRIICVMLWLFIHPFSIEKVFFVDAAEGPQFMNPAIVVNASDGPLVLLVIFLLTELVSGNRAAFRWSRLTTIMLVYLAWSVVSYLTHLVFLADGFVTSSPMALLQDVRLLVFVLLVQSAIRTRGELVMTLLTLAVAILIQTGFVGASYLTGHLFSYAGSTAGEGSGLMGFQGAGGEMVRATGTMGQTNEQAMFHTFTTLALTTFFVTRNITLRVVMLGIVGASSLAIVLTFSRGAWIAFPLGLIVSGVIAARRGLMGRTAMLSGAVLTVLSAVAMLFLAQPIYDRLVYGDGGATESRLRMLALAGDLFKNDPVLGVGPGEFAEAAMRLYPPGFTANQWVKPGERLALPAPYIGRVDIVQGVVGGKVLTRPLPVHNKYMLILSELGVPGLLIWLWFYAALIRIAWRASKQQDLFLQVLAIGGIGTAAAELFYMNVDLFHEDKPLEVMLFVPALMVVVAGCLPGRAPPPYRLG